MLAQHPIRDIMAILLVGIAVTFTACSSDDAPPPVDQSYSGPGSKWDVTLKADGTYTIDKYTNAADTTVDFAVTGTYTTLTSGFKKLTVGTVTGTGGPAVGDTAYAMEVPGFMLALKPAGNSSQLIPMVSTGTCPASDVILNWAKVNTGDGVTDFTTADLAGTFNYVAATGASTVTAAYSVDHTSKGTNALGAGTCANGLLTVSNVDIYLTSAGGAVVNTNNSNPADAEFIFGFGQKAISDISSLNGNYIGVRFRQFDNSLEPVEVICTAGVCTGQGYTNIETGEKASGSVSITFDPVDSPATGLITATITESTKSGRLICMFDKNAAGSGKIIGNCAGYEPDDNTKFFNVLFVSK